MKLQEHLGEEVGGRALRLDAGWLKVQPEGNQQIPSDHLQKGVYRFDTELAPVVAATCAAAGVSTGCKASAGRRDKSITASGATGGREDESVPVTEIGGARAAAAGILASIKVSIRERIFVELSWAIVKASVLLAFVSTASSMLSLRL